METVMPAPPLIIAPFTAFANGTSEDRPSVAVAADGSWSLESKLFQASMISVRSYIHRGTAMGPEGQGSLATLNTTFSVNGGRPDAAFLTNGSHVVVYEKYIGGNNTDIYARIDVRSGGTYIQGTEFLVNAGATINNQRSPEIVALTNGGFAVSWQSSLDLAIRIQRFSATGATEGSMGTIASNYVTTTSGEQKHDMIALDGGGYAVSYSAPGGNQTAKITAFNASGSVIANAVEASAQTGAFGFHGATTLARSSSGAILAAWHDDGGNAVGYRILNASFVGGAVDGAIPFQTLAMGEVLRAAALLDGRFIVVFSNEISGRVWGQLIAASGALDGAAFQISDDFGGKNADVKTLADGRVIVTWLDDSDVYAAMYDPREAGVTVNGSPIADLYVGSDHADLLQGEFDADTIYGGGGNDRIFAMTDGSFLLYGGNDLLFGEAGDDTITGSAGHNILDGGSGVDVLIGLSGGDIYYIDNVSDQIIEAAGAGGGFDYAYTTVSFTQWANVEYVLATGSAALTGTGNSAANTMDATLRFNGVTFLGDFGADVLYGSNYADSISGGGDGDIIFGFLSVNGADTLNGGAGDDVYYVYEADDVLIEAVGGGLDTVYAYANITLSANIEQVLLVGAGTIATGNAQANNLFGNNLAAALTLSGGGGDDWLIGGVGSDTLLGGADNDILQGLGGANRMEGGAGDDQYVSTSLNDIIIEAPGQGRDTLYATYNVAALADNVEQLSISGGATSAVANGLDNTIYGNNSAVGLVLDGAGGNDLIYGSGFADSIFGSLGNDTMVGLGGADRFRYSSTGDLGDDLITDFADGSDRIEITGLGYSAASIGSAITITGGANALISFTSGGLFGTTVRLAGVNQANVTAADFLF
jgi:Ca2+-binding RTX toxin-like protein